jgi:hypothetical protein
MGSTIRYAFSTFTTLATVFIQSLVTIFSQTAVVLNSIEVAIEMLDKKSGIYSDRPVLQMGGELCGWRDNLVLTPYGERFRN